MINRKILSKDINNLVCFRSRLRESSDLADLNMILSNIVGFYCFAVLFIYFLTFCYV